MRPRASATLRSVGDEQANPDPPVRDGLPLPGRTVPDVVSQLCYRVLGPYKNRARSVLHWAGLAGDPPGRLRETAVKFGTTDRAIGQRVRRVETTGARLPLDPALEIEVSRASLPGENDLARRRWARLLGREIAG